MQLLRSMSRIASTHLAKSLRGHLEGLIVRRRVLSIAAVNHRDLAFVKWKTEAHTSSRSAWRAWPATSEVDRHNCNCPHLPLFATSLNSQLCSCPHKFSNTAASPRRAQISRHLHQVNSDRAGLSNFNIDIVSDKPGAGNRLKQDLTRANENDSRHTQKTTPPSMSTQAPHPAVMIPGPIEYDDDVLKSMSHFRCVPSLPNDQ